MFDTVSFPPTPEENAMLTYKFLLEAILASTEVSDSLMDEARVEYDKYFWEDCESGNRQVC